MASIPKSKLQCPTPSSRNLKIKSKIAENDTKKLRSILAARINELLVLKFELFFI